MLFIVKTMCFMLFIVIVTHSITDSKNNSVFQTKTLLLRFFIFVLIVKRQEKNLTIKKSTKKNFWLELNQPLKNYLKYYKRKINAAVIFVMT